MAAAKAALALRAEKEKAEKLAAKQAAKEEKMAIKTGAAAGYVPMEGVQNAGAEEAAFEVDHSSMKPLENMSALEMFMTTWNVWKSLVQATKENRGKPAPVKRAAEEGAQAAKRFAPEQRFGSYAATSDPSICKPEDLGDLHALIFAQVPPASSHFELRVESSRFRAIAAVLKAWKAWKEDYASILEKKQAAAALQKEKEEEKAAKEAEKAALKAQKEEEKEAARKAAEEEKVAQAAEKEAAKKLEEEARKEAKKAAEEKVAQAAEKEAAKKLEEEARKEAKKLEEEARK